MPAVRSQADRSTPCVIKRGRRNTCRPRRNAVAGPGRLVAQHSSSGTWDSFSLSGHSCRFLNGWIRGGLSHWCWSMKRLQCCWSSEESQSSEAGLLRSVMENRTETTQCAGPKPGLTLGYDGATGEELVLPDRLLTQHMAVVGSSGAGKTSFLLSLIYQQMRRGGAVIFMDGKRRYSGFAKVAWLAHACGRAADLRVIDPQDPTLSHAYNPLLARDAEREAGIIANKIHRLLPSVPEGHPASYYSNLAYTAILKMVRALHHLKRGFSYRDILAIFETPDQAFRILKQDLYNDNASDSLIDVEKFVRKFKGTAQVSDLLSGLISELGAISSTPMGDFLCRPVSDVDFYQAIKKSQIIYAALPCLVVLDEFGSYALPDFAVVFEQAREANVAVVAAFQLTSQLADREKGLSTGFLETVMGNTETKVFMRLKSLESALWASEFFGQELRWFAQVSAGESQSDAEQVISLRRYVNPRRTDSRTSSLTHRQMYDQRVRPEALLH